MKRLILLFLVITSTHAFAQTDTTKELSEVKLYGIRSYERSPITQTTITKTVLDANNYGYEPAVLIARTPSVTFSSDGGNNNGYIYYRIRGIDQTRINATLNGIPLNEPEDQGAYFSNYPDFLSNVSSIQIQRGVGISSTGTSSFGGSLNFEGPDLRKKIKKLDLTFGSWDTYRAGLTLATGLKKNFATYVRVSGLNSDGYRDHSGTRGKTLFFSTGYFKGKHTLKLTSFFGESKNDMAYLGSEEKDIKIKRTDNPITADEKDKFYQNLNALQYTYKSNEHVTFSTSVFYNRLKGNYDILFTPDMFNFRLQSNFYGAIAAVNIKRDELELNVGTNVNLYDREHSLVINKDYLIYKNRGHKNDFNVWVKTSYDIDKFKLFGDMQYRAAKFSYKGFYPKIMTAKPVNWDFLNMRFGLSYKFDTYGHFYAMMGASHREPIRNDIFAGYDDLDSLNFNEIGDFTKVKYESVYDLEVGFNYATPEYNVKIDVFNMNFRNEIAPIGQLSMLGLPLRKNIDKSRRNGVETEVTVKLSSRFEVYGNFTYMLSKIKEYTNIETGKTYFNNTHLLTPRTLGNLNVSYKYKTLNVGGAVNYTSKSYLDNENTAVNDGAAIVGAFINWKWFQLRVDNILNTDKYSSGYVYAGKKYFYVYPKINYQLTFTKSL